MRWGTACSSWPSGPFTLTRPGAIETSTPAGTGIGFLPILLNVLAFSPSSHPKKIGAKRDLLRVSPDKTDDFSADAELLRLAARDHAARGGEDRRPHSAENAREPLLARVDPPAGLRDPLQVGDDPLAIPAELELDDKRIEALALPDEVVLDVALLLEEAGDLDLQLRAGHLARLVESAVRVPDPRQHVGDRVSKHRRCSSPRALRHARDDAGVREVPQADPAEAELAVDRTRAPAAVAARVVARLVLLRPGGLHDQARLRHSVPLYSGRNGRPSSRKSASASSSVLAVVVMLTSRPRIASTSS